MKTLFFDLGKVLVDFDWTPAVIKMAERSSAAFDEILNLVTRSDLAMQYECGRISSELFFTQLRDLIGFRDSARDLRAIWANIFSPMNENLDAVRRCKGRYDLGMISNTNEAHASWIREHFSIFELFDRIVLSYEVGHVKPDPSMYDVARDGRSTDQVWFVDDIARHVGGARAAGWRAAQLLQNQSLEDVLIAEGFL